jgi:HK97 family phage major capsid protein
MNAIIRNRPTLRATPPASPPRPIAAPVPEPERKIEPAAVRSQLARLLGMEQRDVELLCISTAAWVAENLLGREEVAVKLWARKGVEMFRVERAAGAGSGSIGGFLVPQQIADAVIQLRNVASVLRANATIWNMPSDELVVPRRRTGWTASYIAEGSALVATDLGFDSVTLTAKKLGVFARLSTELAEDSAVDLGAYFMAELGWALGDAEDGAGFIGDGTSAYGGMRGAATILQDGQHGGGSVASASGHTAFSLMDAVDLSSMMNLLPEFAWPGAKFFCSGYAAAQLFCRLGATGGGTSVETFSGSRPQLSYAGIPIVVTPKMPGSGADLRGKTCVLFGDMSRAIALGSRREISLMSSSQRYLDTDQVAVRGLERLDVVVHSVGDATTAGAIVGLVGAAS